MTTIVIAGGTVVDAEGERRADVVIDDESGLITAVGPDLGAADASGGDQRTLAAKGCVVCPGFVDLNTHLRQPGSEEAETIASAASAAALGGYTAVVAMPDTTPCTDSAAVVAEIRALARSVACEIVPAAAITIDRAGHALAPLGELVDVGVCLFTDAGSALTDSAVLRRAMEYLGGIAEGAGACAVVANRGDLPSLSSGGVMNEGEWSARLGLPGQPAVAEELAVGRDLAVARLSGCPLHVQQISTAGAVALVRAAKADGQIVTAEVSPHHLVLDESACAGFDPNTKLTPPLRTAADVQAVRAGLADGTIDAIATGHSPWPVNTKERPFDEAPAGVIGLQTAMAVLLTDLDVALSAVLPALSWQPAAIAGLGDRHGGPIAVGRPANLAVVDTDAAWTVTSATMASRSINTPFVGRTLIGRIRHTILNGRPVVLDGALRTNDRGAQDQHPMPVGAPA